MPTLKELMDEMKPVSLNEIKPGSTFSVECDVTRAKGGIRAYYTVWCGSCDEFRELGGKTIRACGTEAKKLGWRNTRERGWLCPECVAEGKEHNA